MGSSNGFAPKGEFAEWRMIYEFVKDLPPDSVITYSTISSLVQREFPGNNRRPITRVCQELRAVNQRTMVSVPTVGYRIARSNEHVVIAKGHQNRARTQIMKAVEVLDATDRDDLTTGETQELDRQSHVAYQIRDAMKAHERRKEKDGKDLQSASQGPRIADPVANLTERVDGLSGRMQELLDRIQAPAS